MKKRDRFLSLKGFQMSLLFLPKEILDKIFALLDGQDCVNLLCTCSYIYERCQTTLFEQRELKLEWKNSCACSERTTQVLACLQRTGMYQEIHRLELTANVHHYYWSSYVSGEEISKELEPMIRLQKLTLNIMCVGVLQHLISVLPKRLQILKIYLMDLRPDQLSSQSEIKPPISGLRGLRVCYKGRERMSFLTIRMRDILNRRGGLNEIDRRTIDRSTIMQLREMESQRRLSPRESLIDKFGHVLAQLIQAHRHSLQRIQIKGFDSYVIFRNPEAIVYMPCLFIIEMCGLSIPKLQWWMNELEPKNSNRRFIAGFQLPPCVLVGSNAHQSANISEGDPEFRYLSHFMGEPWEVWISMKQGSKEAYIRKIMNYPRGSAA